MVSFDPQKLCFLGEVVFNDSTYNKSTMIQCNSWIYNGVERSAVTEVRFESTLPSTISTELVMSNSILAGAAYLKQRLMDIFMELEKDLKLQT